MNEETNIILVRLALFIIVGFLCFVAVVSYDHVTVAAQPSDTADMSVLMQRQNAELHRIADALEVIAGKRK